MCPGNSIESRVSSEDGEVREDGCNTCPDAQATRIIVVIEGGSHCLTGIVVLEGSSECITAVDDSDEDDEDDCETGIIVILDGGSECLTGIVIIQGGSNCITAVDDSDEDDEDDCSTGIIVILDGSSQCATGIQIIQGGSHCNTAVDEKSDEVGGVDLAPNTDAEKSDEGRGGDFTLLDVSEDEQLVAAGVGAGSTLSLLALALRRRLLGSPL